MTSMIKVTAFDLSRVIYLEGLDKAIISFVEKYKMSEDEARNLLQGESSIPYLSGKEDVYQYLNRFQSVLGTDFSLDDIKQKIFDANKLRPEMLLVLMTLKDSPIKTAFISDFPKEEGEYLEEKYQVLQNFNFGVYAWQEGEYLPAKALYQRLIYKSGVEANEILYIDNREDFLTPAQELGLQTYLYTTTEDYCNNILPGILDTVSE